MKYAAPRLHQILIINQYTTFVVLSYVTDIVSPPVRVGGWSIKKYTNIKTH